MVAAPKLAPINRATRLAHRCIERLCLRPPIDVTAVARACHIPILEQPPGGPEGDAFLAYYDGRDRWAIFLNPRCQDPRRRRFSIAHELGHYILHREEIRQGNPLSDPSYEWEANEFASELLMPANELPMAMSLAWGELDHRFGVSVAAINHRLRTMGYRGW